MVRVLLAILLFFMPAAAQQKPAAKREPRKPVVKTRTCPQQTDAQVCERGWQLLDAAEAEASDLREGGTRAFAQLQVARAYAATDKNKAIELLNAAFTATLALPDGSKETKQGRIEATQEPELQRQILQSLVILAPGEAEEKLPQASPSIREAVFETLLGYYEKTKRLDAALEMVSRITRDSGFPYAAASRLMRALPPERSAERQQLFAAALSSFRMNPPERNAFRFGSSDFPDLIVQYWKEMPAGLVREAIDEVLKQANKNPEGEKPVRVTLGYREGGNAVLSSMYEYRLFQLLPVLRQIDPGSAESLLRDREALAKQFDAYSQAGSPRIGSISVGASAAPPRRTRYEINAPAPGDPPETATQRIMAIEDPNVRADLLLLCGRTQIRWNDSVAEPTSRKSCLDKLVDTVAAQLPPSEQVGNLAQAASLYLDLKEELGATKAISAVQAAADKLYADDTDSSNPNKALKAYWPSTNAYIRLVRLAGRVSPDLALGMIKEMRDEEIRPLLRIALAGTWIGVPLGPVTVINKNGGWSQNSGSEERR